MMDLNPGGRRRQVYGGQSDRTRRGTRIVVQHQNDELSQQIVYAVSHDLRAPARHVHAFVDLLAKHLDDQLDDVGAGYLSRLNDAADMLEQKLVALTRFSRAVTEAVEPRCYSASEAVSEAVELLETEIFQANATVVAEPLPAVYADPTQLVTVFTELIDNSLKFCPDGPTIRLRSESTEGGHMILVGDDGPGFREQDAQAAFQLFRRFHGASIPGTGTGLAIVERIVRRHGGRVTIDTGVTGGAQVAISLPATAETYPLPADVLTMSRS